jgi:hypothetical protein
VISPLEEKILPWYVAVLVLLYVIDWARGNRPLWTAIFWVIVGTACAIILAYLVPIA